jgi:hypothetical protein
MEHITVTFPKEIPPEMVIFLIESNMKKNSEYECKVEPDRFNIFEDDENGYTISTLGGGSAFYLIGMTASEIIAAFYKKQSK